MSPVVGIQQFPVGLSIWIYLLFLCSQDSYGVPAGFPIGSPMGFLTVVSNVAIPTGGGVSYGSLYAGYYGASCWDPIWGGLLGFGIS